MESQKLRADKFLWAIRIFKSRALATEACNKGKVKYNGNSIKPSRPVAAGDHYEISTEQKKWRIEVCTLLYKRVNYEEASKHYIDHSEVMQSQKQGSAFIFNTGKRKSKQGRPTKKEKRNLDELWE